MKHCKNCGNEIAENAKFCSGCGSPNNFDDVRDEPKRDNSGRKNLKVIIFLITFILLFAAVGGLVFMKINASQKENMKKSIEVLSVEVDNYPDIIVSIKANNYEKKLETKNFTLKEGDAFQKELTLLDGVEKNEYKISYKTSSEASGDERDIKVACLDGNNEAIAESSYKAPEKKQSDDKTEKTNNVVNTYDNNEVVVKQAIEDYEKAYIRMVNSKDIYYIKNSIDLSGGLISEFTNLIKSYSDQNISEDLVNHKIEEIKKVNDSQYEVTAYEKYYIFYGKEKKSTYTDFRTTYIVNKTDLGFKVYSIKNVSTLGSKTNPN